MKSSIVVTALYVYPIKSLGGVSVSKTILTDRGFALDRRWLLIDDKGVFLTQRAYPAMVHFEVKILENGLEIYHKLEKKTCYVPFEIDQNKSKINVTVWDDVFEAIEVSEEISNWFTGFFDQKVRLVYQPQDSERKVDSRYAKTSNDLVSAADGYPVLMISEASLGTLNDKLEEAVSMDRFRPNMVVSGLEAFQEDEIAEVAVGSASLIGVKISARCILININGNGEVGKEPLKTLSTFRKRDNKVYFGQNMLVKTQGQIAVGDSLIF